MSKPVQGKADTTGINSWLHAVLNAKRGRIIDKQLKSIGEYGLEDPFVLLTLTLKSNNALSGLLLGDKNPSGFFLYARRGDQPAVFLAANTLTSRMDRKAADLRDKTLLAFEPDAEGAAISGHRRGEGRRPLDGYGLKSPQAEVELTMADGIRLPALLFGKAERDRLYAKVATGPAVYAIDPKFLNRLPDGPDALK